MYSIQSFLFHYQYAVSVRQRGEQPATAFTLLVPKKSMAPSSHLKTSPGTRRMCSGAMPPALVKRIQPHDAIAIVSDGLKSGNRSDTGNSIE
jgi:hypothetical protein